MHLWIFQLRASQKSCYVYRAIEPATSWLNVGCSTSELVFDAPHPSRLGILGLNTASLGCPYYWSYTFILSFPTYSSSVDFRAPHGILVVCFMFTKSLLLTWLPIRFYLSMEWPRLLDWTAYLKLSMCAISTRYLGFYTGWLPFLLNFIVEYLLEYVKT